MSSGNTSSSVPPSSSSSGDSYFYPARSSPIRISHPRPRWSDFLDASPIPVTPDPEHASPELCAQLDWDPRSEVPMEVGEVVHGRYVHWFPSNWLRETDRH